MNPEVETVQARIYHGDHEPRSILVMAAPWGVKIETVENFLQGLEKGIHPFNGRLFPRCKFYYKSPEWEELTEVEVTARPAGHMEAIVELLVNGKAIRHFHLYECEVYPDRGEFKEEEDKEEPAGADL